MPWARLDRMSELPVGFVLRRADPSEAIAVADVWLRSRHASVPAIPAPVHTDAEVRGWFREVVLPDREVWVVVGPESDLAGMLSMEPGWIDQLHVDPPWFGHGLGSVLVERAKVRQPGGLDLWTFASNAGARRFYERHGFVAVDATDGDNEEGEPDVRYRWPG
jgi:GNAT superfamily N-acetyltransferase